MLNLLGVIIAFIVIIILIRKKLNFGLSLILGSFIVGVFSVQEMDLIDIPKAIIEASFYSFKTNQIATQTIELALLMTLIYILAKLMQVTGAITKLIDSLRTFFSKGGTLGVIPAVYGLMPVPGGALFSAPMINEEGDKYHLNKNQKNFLNVWFRHVWFPIYPISSAMILICSEKFSDINIYSLILANVPAFIIIIIIGFIFLKKFIANTTMQQTNPKRDYSGLMFLLPPIMPLVFYAVLQPLGFSQIRSFLIGIVFSIILVYFITNINMRDYIEALKKSLTWKLGVAIFGIMIFREIFEVSGANVIIAEMIGNLPFPAIWMVALIPLLLGSLTGYNLGAIALSYFLVEPFFLYTGINIIGLTSIIFMSSFVGYLVSPIHLCNVLSSDYLKTDTTRMYKMFIPAAVLLILIHTAIVVFSSGF
jgi:integral membrane protein (TIGR00529 family)